MVGLIPAHAGKTRVLGEEPAPVEAHPRSRGENDGRLIAPLFGGGSSPLTRGKRQSGVLHGLFGRLIPAHAGKTPRKATGRRSPSAHPRSRGENALNVIDSDVVTGSSPLTRGKLRVTSLSPAHLRLIPAHAGKTAGIRGRGVRRSAHPRSRGENASCSGPIPNEAGSSPLTRGKLTRSQSGNTKMRLIPAHAGKTTTTTCTFPASPAHPRSRGENRPMSRPMSRVTGSSPLTRGKHDRGAGPRRRVRLIPAHAGKT